MVKKNVAYSDWFSLSKSQNTFLIIYFLLCILWGLVSTVLTILNEDWHVFNTLIAATIYGSTGISLLGSSIFYLRKLYKIYLNLLEMNGDEKKKIGTFLYFFLRPIYSAAFAMIIILFIKAGVFIVTDETKLNNNFLYFTMVLSFFAGFASGDFLDFIENEGKTFFMNVFKRKING